MARYLQKGREIDLKLCAGMIVAFKPDKFDLSAVPLAEGHETQLELYNQNGDITICIIIRRGQDKVFFNDHADQSLLDGWGQEQSVDLDPLDLRKWRSGVTISVHDCSTRYQILFNLTTVFNFEKHFLGPATKVAYREVRPQFNSLYPSHLPDRLKLFSYKLSDLPLVERQAIESGRVPLTIPVPVSAAISIPLSRLIPNQLWACVSSGDGKEFRTYHLGPGNVLQESSYSRKNGWRYGNLQNLKIVLDPSSNLVATRRADNDSICLFYQGPNSDLIRILYQGGPDKPWHKYRTTAKGAKGSSIAVAMCFNMNRVLGRFCFYYQDPELHLREYFYDRSMHHWFPGGFNPGVQPRGTPITAEAVHGGDVDINVMWRDMHGRPVSSSWRRSSGWDLSNNDSKPLDGRD